MGLRSIGIVAIVGALVALSACLEPEDRSVTALDPLTGESGEFSDPSAVPEGWEPCSDPTCDAERDALCPDDACGPALGMPSTLCDDGTVAGPTGRCLLDVTGACTWEVLSCPSDPPTGECAEDECGPMPMMPAMICADGSVGGNTGRCLRDPAGTCGWEIRACPEDGTELCDEAECGPALGAPAIICADGTIGGNTGRCLRDPAGGCGWEIRDCPDDGGELCDESECGPAMGMPAYYCADGSLAGNTGRCLRDPAGVCGWEVRECPDDGTELCEDTGCGPALGLPAWTCADGSVGGNTGRCLRDPSGSCGWEIRDCPESDPSA